MKAPRDPRQTPPVETPAGEPSDDELVLYHYGEHADPATIAAWLAASPRAAERYAELAATLDAADAWLPPEQPAGYESALWTRLQPELASRRRATRLLVAAHRFGTHGVRWAGVAAAAALLVAIGFLAGRTAPPGGTARTPPLSAEARQRILVDTLAEHLERSQRLFTELENAGTPAGAIGDERLAARDLLSANRLYRTAAQRGGHAGVAALLADIEPVLVELAHLPADADPRELADLRRRIDERGLLFKTRVASELLDRSLRPASPAPAGPTV